MTMKWKTLGALALATTAAACTETSRSEKVGSFDTAITATGSDGSLYRLPPESYVQVFNAAYSDIFPLDGDAATMSFDVPVGSYSIYLYNPFSMGAEWQLERTNVDMTTETVSATLITPLPVAVTIVEDQVTSVVFQFQVPDGGTVTFAEGELEVSINVDEQSATGGRARFDGWMTYAANELVGGPPDMATRFPLAGESVWEMGEVVVDASGWVQRSSTRVCAPGTWWSYGSSHPAPFDMLQETLSGNAIEVCVTSGPNPQVSVAAQRSGAPTTPTFADVASNMHFYKQFYGNLPFQVYDGSTLDLDAMAGSVTIQTWSFETADSGDGTFWYEGNYDGLVNFTYTPQL